MTIYGRSVELVSRCVKCHLAEPESLASLGGSAPGLVDGILSQLFGDPMFDAYSDFNESIKSTKQFINTLSDNIRKQGAMDTLISDGGKYEISKQVTNLLRSLFIQDYQSEPYHQHQNKAENRFGLAKHYTNTVMNTSGWLPCLLLATLFAVHL